METKTFVVLFLVFVLCGVGVSSDWVRPLSSSNNVTNNITVYNGTNNTFINFTYNITNIYNMSNGWSNTSTVVYTTDINDNVGIGTTNATEKLTILGGLGIKSGSTIRLYNPTNTAYSSIYLNSVNNVQTNYPWYMTSNLGLNIMSPSYLLDVNGSSRINGTMILDGSNAYGQGSQTPATTNYLQSRLLNLVTNGNGLMNNNYNFAVLIYDPIETHGGGGSFYYDGTATSKISDELIPINPTLTYKLNLWAKSGNISGVKYNTSARFYFGIAEYDIDGNTIQPIHSIKYSANTVDTFLTAPLNYGDTVVYANNLSGWYNLGTATSRHFVWWPYTNRKGYSYPNYTYTRNTTGTGGFNPSYYSTTGAWNLSGINTTTNIITLSKPWTGPNLSNGTAIRNGPEGSTYKYIAGVNLPVSNNWTEFTGYIGKKVGDDIYRSSDFSSGVSYLKILFLLNYPSGNPQNIIRVSDISLTNIENTYSIYGGQNYTWNNQGVNTLTLTSSNNVGIGTITPIAKLDVNGSFHASNISVHASDNFSQSMCLNVSQTGTVTAYKC